MLSAVSSALTGKNNKKKLLLSSNNNKSAVANTSAAVQTVATSSAGSSNNEQQRKTLSKLGHGSFGFVLMAQDITPTSTSTSNANKTSTSTGGRRVAIKFERANVRKSVLKLEIVILRQLQSTSQYVCRYYGCGRCPLDLSSSSTANNSTNNGGVGGLQEYSYVVMELLGPSLSVLLKKRCSEKFSLGTTALLSRQMLSAIRSLHELGYLHRDIKPSNFALSLHVTDGEVRHRCFMIDFGLCRRYVSSHGALRPARSKVGFRGTARYASLTAHQNKDLSRRDDLISLFYVLAEFLLGTLPWKGLKDKDEIARLKMKETPNVVSQLPDPLQKFYESVNKLRFSDCPRYDYLESLLVKLFALSGQPEDIPYDWDIVAEDTLGSIETSIISARNNLTTRGDHKSVTMTVDTQQKPLCTTLAMQEESQQQQQVDSVLSPESKINDQMVTSVVEMNDNTNIEDHKNTRLHSPKPPSESLKSPRKQFSARLRRLRLYDKTN